MVLLTWYGVSGSNTDPWMVNISKKAAIFLLEKGSDKAVDGSTIARQLLVKKAKTAGEGFTFWKFSRRSL